MVKDTSLSSFLRKEVLKSKIKGQESSRKGESAFDRLKRGPRRRNDISSIFDDSTTYGSSDGNSKSQSMPKDDEIDTKSMFSLFNERVKEPRTKEDHLQEFLANVKPKELSKPGGSQSTPKHAELEALRDELASLVAFEETLNIHERRPIRKQREKLAFQINVLRVEVDKIEKEQRTVRPSLSLQPPVDSSKRKKILNTTRQARGTNIGAEKTHLKRARQDDDVDLDGEERLRLGKSLKKRKAEHSPRWKNARRTRTQDAVQVISPEQAERLRLRRQLADAEKKKAIEEMERVMREADRANDLG